MTGRVQAASLKILGHEIGVFDLKHLLRDTEHYGEWLFCDLSITVDADLVPSVKQAILCHEIVESWNTLEELNLPHSKIQALGNCLFQLLNENDPYIFQKPTKTSQLFEVLRKDLRKTGK